MTDTQYLDGFIGELLHINEVSDNKLIDLGSGGGANAFVLTHTCIDVCAYALGVISERIGKTGNTILLNSALAGGEQRVNRHLNTFEWKSFNGGTDVKTLHSFIQNARKDLIARGNNPLFLSVGALKWRVAVKDGAREALKDITTPLLIFPVRLVVTNNSSPVSIEFIDDEIYINPCLVAKLTQVFGEELVAGLPKIGGTSDLNSPVDLTVLGDGTEYFKSMAAYIESCNHTDGADSTRFEFDKDFIAVAQYKHDELCTYYDIRRNKDKIYSHPLVSKLFEKSSPDVPDAENPVLPDYVLMRDSVQEKIITRVVNGESLIIKGPPGTGKTVTIANMLATLLSQNKRVLFASKKISALTEVYAKLPERLRKFAMLLDSETEASAAKLRPEEIKQDFKRLLSDCKQYREPPQLGADIKQAMAERSKAMRSLSAYIETLFNDKCIAEDSFYAALDATCKLNMPVIEFADGDEAIKVTRAQYNYMLERAGEAQKHFNVLGAEGARPVYKCPWFGIDLSCDTESAMKSCAEIGDKAYAIYRSIEGGLKEYGLAADKFTLSNLSYVTESKLGTDGILAVFANAKSVEAVGNIERRLNDFIALPELNINASVNLSENEKIGDYAVKLGATALDKTLTPGELKLLNDNAAVFTYTDGSFIGGDSLDTLVKTVNKIEEYENEKFALISRSQEVFKQDLSEEQLKSILDAYTSLSAYCENCPEKPRALDFKGKKAFARMCELSYLSAPRFKEVVKAVEEYARAGECQRKINTALEAVYKLFRRQLTGEQVECIRVLVNKCKDVRKNAQAYLNSVCDNFAFVSERYAAVGGTDVDKLDFGSLVALYEREFRLNLLSESLTAFNEIVKVYGEENRGEEAEIARSVIGTARFIEAAKAQNATAENVVKAVEFIRGLGYSLRAEIDGVVNGLNDFGSKFFRNFYVINGIDNLLGDLLIMQHEADDRDVISAAINYTALKNNPQNALNLASFLYWFEKGGELPQGATFKDAFEHSFFSLAVRSRDKRLGLMRNGLGSFASDNIAKLREADEKLNDLHAQLIESKCLARIKPNDDDFIFIQDRNPNENLRLMFKRHARAVMKLKKCLILSPYTASLLFRNDEFDNFDVLIVDEASQLEPALVLPVLFRSKQCVIVGDEWQMPPIKHFATLSPAQDSDDGEGYGALEPEISVLGLALRNEGYPVEELICHYRSKTETLIKFSQESFYPNMRTFPAPVPAMAPSKGQMGLGLKDVYVPDGYVLGGRNIAEAEQVVKELKQHFDNYYDGNTHTLAMSVGVVAFGESQCAAIVSRVQADKELQKKIDDALAHFGDLPEKLIFFKTIETVQGQEVGHIILSLTHGKRENGLYMHFGQLNQGKLGRCVFNVAVTRAQYMVTVVHSVRAVEITGANIEYIRDYLKTVERFSQADGNEQFVSEKTGRGFINEVAGFIMSKGIAANRVVMNYGVTEGSVRIPLAVLDKDLKRAVLGVWCEKPTGGKYDFLDYNMRYKNSLAVCGWKLHDIFIHDWTDNRQSEEEALEKVLKTIIKEEEENNQNG